MEEIFDSGVHQRKGWGVSIGWCPVLAIASRFLDHTDSHNLELEGPCGGLQSHEFYINFNSANSRQNVEAW